MGNGELGAKYFIIGEAPGANEDKEGIPFVGQAGKRLDKLLKLANIDINSCYLTNVCKCRPPDNRVPRKQERIACYPWLKQELEIIKPEVIITLGSTPLSLFSDQGVKQMHGSMFTSEEGYKVIAQYHPAAALHQPRLWATLIDDWSHMPTKVDANYIIADYTPDLPKGKLIAMDTENDVTGQLGQWSIACRDAEGKLIVSPYAGSKPNFPWADNMVVMHNARWDLKVLDAARMPRPKNYADTMIAAYVLGYGHQESGDSAKGKADSMIGGLGLKYLARRNLGLEMKTWQMIKDKPDEVPEYNAMDSVATYLLFEKWLPILPKFFWDIDMPLLGVCMAMEDRGMLVDPEFLKRYAESLDGQLTKIDLGELNPFSPPQIIKYVYGKLGIEPTKFTEGNQPSTASEVLEGIDDPIVKNILKYRELYKERKTYVSSYTARMDAFNRVHPEFKQTRTATGRLSCASPNLHNVTKDTELRKLFIAPEGKILIDLDFDQLELRVFAAIANESAMLETLARYDKSGKKEDKIHSQTSRLIGVSYDDAKVINFLMLYGGGAWKISQEFHVPIDDAKALIAKYYKSYPGIKQFHEKMIAIAHEKHEVENWVGRKRHLDSMLSENWRTIKEGEREAVNTPVQGGAGEVFKIAMIDLHYKHSCPMLSQVHDELIIEYDEKHAKDYAQWLKEYVPTLTIINGVKFPVDVKCGKNWAEAH
jgi:DNA polymerase-1